MKLLLKKRGAKALAMLPTVLFVLACTHHSSEKIVLRLNLEKGKSYAYTITMNQETGNMIMGQNFKVSNNMLFGFGMLVNDIDKNGNMDLKTTVSHVKISMAIPGKGNINFDTDSPSVSEGKSAKMAVALKGATFNMQMTPSGMVKSITGYDSVFHKMTPAYKSADSTQFKGPDVLKDRLGDSAMIQVLNNAWSFYPNKEVGEGDSWTSKIPMKNDVFPLTINSVYTVQEINAKSVILKVESKIEMQRSPGANESGSNFKFEGTQTGTIELDKTTGMIILSDLKQEMLATISMGKGGQGIPITINGSLKVEGKK